MVKLLLWNVDLTPDLSIKNFFRNSKQRYRLIAQFIKDYDIVVLNESFLYRKELLKLVDHKYIFADKKPFFKIFNSGVVILSRFPFTDPEYHHYTHNASWDVFISKGILKVSFNIEGKKFDLYGTHMQQSNGRRAQNARKSQVYEVVNFIQKTKKPENDIILVGDLNMGPVSDVDNRPVYYSSADDARQRNEQFTILANSFNFKDFVEEEEICHLLHAGNMNVKRFFDDDPHLSDTGPFFLEF